jgi:hypothetical protein
LNRRDLLFFGTNRRVRTTEVSCERLYMQFCDSQLNNTTQQLLERLETELHQVDELRLLDSGWLVREDLRQWVEPLLKSVKAHGGRIEFVRTLEADRGV